MTSGRLIAVVGPSGVGKDSVMRGIHEARPDMHLVQRVITRAPGLGGEDYQAVSVSEFRDMARQGAFAVHWEAHGLHYGIPQSTVHRLQDGTDCLVNFSRKALLDAASVFSDFLVLHITASADTLATRLAARGRETADEISKRLAQAEKPLPSGLDVIHISNDGPLDQTISQALEMVQQVRV